MNETLTFTINPETTQRLKAYAELLNMTPQSMLDEALEQYFERKDEEIARQDPMTNLSYDEFWDDLDF